MRHPDRLRPRPGPASSPRAPFAVGDRVLVVGAPASYGYNGRAGTIVTIDGSQIHVQVDEPPGDMQCTAFYSEELLQISPAPDGDQRSIR